MITIETIRENKNNMGNDTKDEIMNVISSELIQVKSEEKMKLKSISTRINRSVPETRRVLQENKQIKEKKSNPYIDLPVPESCTTVHDAQQYNTPTDTIKNLKEQTQIFKDKTGKKTEAHVHKVTESTVLGQEIRDTIDPPILRNNETNLDQIIDTRLLLNNKNSTLAEEFTDMIREYNTYGNSSINEVGARSEWKHLRMSKYITGTDRPYCSRKDCFKLDTAL
jgi:hypothetical protein